MKQIYIFWLLTVTLGISGCSNWMDVSPKTEVNAEDLYTTEDGFKSALIGIYGRMTLDALYGRDLSFLFIEQLAQRYDNKRAETDADRAFLYDYTNNSSVKGTLSSIWNGMYKNIANINNLLENIEENGANIITPGYLEIIKGEALALRAFHYFDLLRMWGPIYQADSTGGAVPYRDKFTPDKAPVMSANELMAKIITDLEEAKHLLKNDQLDYGIVALDQPFLTYRQHRLNKFATQALLARVYLYRGAKESAAREAKAVIDGCGLDLVRNNREDLGMFDEALFALNMYDMEKRVKGYFTESTAGNGEELWVTFDNIQNVFETATCGINDIRYKNGYGFLHKDNKGMCRKFLPAENFTYKEKIPMIRLSEMYYIIAEGHATTDGADYINTVRNTRGISRKDNLAYYSESAWIDELEKEYQKDFFCEGQFFYFLKRHARKNFYRCPVSGGMVPEYYQFRIPDAEVEFGSVER